MVRQLASPRLLLKPGAMLGYEICRLDLFQERFATATRTQIREEVLVLRWPGQE